MLTKVEAARQKYQPKTIKYLLVAEAPPKEDSERFFYFEHVYTQDSLFLETMKVLYPNDTLDTKHVRRHKSEFLERFKRDGFYLLDSVDTPIADQSKKRNEIRQALPELQKKLTALGQENARIVLISATVYEVCSEILKANKFNIINREMIDFPGSGGQIKFREKFGRLLQEYGFESKQATL